MFSLIRVQVLRMKEDENEASAPAVPANLPLEMIGKENSDDRKNWINALASNISSPDAELRKKASGDFNTLNRLLESEPELCTDFIAKMYKAMLKHGKEADGKDIFMNAFLAAKIAHTHFPEKVETESLKPELNKMVGLLLEVKTSSTAKSKTPNIINLETFAGQPYVELLQDLMGRGIQLDDFGLDANQLELEAKKFEPLSSEDISKASADIQAGKVKGLIKKFNDLAETPPEPKKPKDREERDKEMEKDIAKRKAEEDIAKRKAEEEKKPDESKDDKDRLRDDIVDKRGYGDQEDSAQQQNLPSKDAEDNSSSSGGIELNPITITDAHLKDKDREEVVLRSLLANMGVPRSKIHEIVNLGDPGKKAKGIDEASGLPLMMVKKLREQAKSIATNLELDQLNDKVREQANAHIMRAGALQLRTEGFVGKNWNDTAVIKQDCLERGMAMMQEGLDNPNLWTDNILNAVSDKEDYIKDLIQNYDKRDERGFNYKERMKYFRNLMAGGAAVYIIAQLFFPPLAFVGALMLIASATSMVLTTAVAVVQGVLDLVKGVLQIAAAITKVVPTLVAAVAFTITLIPDLVVSLVNVIRNRGRSEADKLPLFPISKAIGKGLNKTFEGMDKVVNTALNPSSAAKYDSKDDRFTSRDKVQSKLEDKYKATITAKGQAVDAPSVSKVATMSAPAAPPAPSRLSVSTDVGLATKGMDPKVKAEIDAVTAELMARSALAAGLADAEQNQPAAAPATPPAGAHAADAGPTMMNGVELPPFPPQPSPKQLANMERPDLPPPPAPAVSPNPVANSVGEGAAAVGSGDGAPALAAAATAVDPNPVANSVDVPFKGDAPASEEADAAVGSSPSVDDDMEVESEGAAPAPVVGPAADDSDRVAADEKVAGTAADEVPAPAVEEVEPGVIMNNDTKPDATMLAGNDAQNLLYDDNESVGNSEASPDSVDDDMEVESEGTPAGAAAVEEGAAPAAEAEAEAESGAAIASAAAAAAAGEGGDYDMELESVDAPAPAAATVEEGAAAGVDQPIYSSAGLLSQLKDPVASEDRAADVTHTDDDMEIDNDDIANNGEAAAAHAVAADNNKGEPIYSSVDVPFKGDVPAPPLPPKVAARTDDDDMDIENEGIANNVASIGEEVAPAAGPNPLANSIGESAADQNPAAAVGSGDDAQPPASTEPTQEKNEAIIEKINEDIDGIINSINNDPKVVTAVDKFLALGEKYLEIKKQPGDLNYDEIIIFNKEFENILKEKCKSELKVLVAKREVGSDQMGLFESNTIYFTPNGEKPKKEYLKPALIKLWDACSALPKAEKIDTKEFHNAIIGVMKDLKYENKPDQNGLKRINKFLTEMGFMFVNTQLIENGKEPLFDPKSLPYAEIENLIPDTLKEKYSTQLNVWAVEAQSFLIATTKPQEGNAYKMGSDEIIQAYLSSQNQITNTLEGIFEIPLASGSSQKGGNKFKLDDRDIVELKSSYTKVIDKLVQDHYGFELDIEQIAQYKAEAKSEKDAVSNKLSKPSKTPKNKKEETQNLEWLKELLDQGANTKQELDKKEIGKLLIFFNKNPEAQELLQRSLDKKDKGVRKHSNEVLLKLLKFIPNNPEIYEAVCKKTNNTNDRIDTFKTIINAFGTELISKTKEIVNAIEKAKMVPREKIRLRTIKIIDRVGFGESLGQLSLGAGKSPNSLASDTLNGGDAQRSIEGGDENVISAGQYPKIPDFTYTAGAVSPSTSQYGQYPTGIGVDNGDPKASVEGAGPLAATLGAGAHNDYRAIDPEGNYGFLPGDKEALAKVLAAKEEAIKHNDEQSYRGDDGARDPQMPTRKAPTPGNYTPMGGEGLGAEAATGMENAKRAAEKEAATREAARETGIAIVQHRAPNADKNGNTDPQGKSKVEREIERASLPIQDGGSGRSQ